MIHLQEIDGRRAACWVNNGSFLPERRTLVFIHSSGFDHTNWIHQYTPLKNLFNIVALDLPGHGRSEGPGKQELPAYVCWVRKAIDGLGIERPVMIGHSLGAAICLSFAILYGDRCTALVPVGGGLKMPVNPLILEGLRQDPAAVIGLAAKFSVAKANRERLSGLLTECLTGVDPVVLYGDFLACSSLDVELTAGEIRVPTLVVCGIDDKMTPPALSEGLRNRIGGSRLSLIEGAGHFVMLEQPEAFNIVLIDFLDSLPW